MLIRIPSPAFRRDVALVVAGLALGVAFTRGCHSSYQASTDKPIETSSYQADRRIDQAKSRLQSHPEDLDALSDLAIGFFLKGPEHFADGVNALEKARALGSTDERLFFYAGVMYETLGLLDYAANDFGRYLRHHPDDYESLVHLANVLFKMKKYDEARALYRRALDEWPKDPTVWFNYAVVMVGKAEADEAERALARVKKIAGELPEGGRYVEGEIARLRSQDDNAIVAYEGELSVHPNYVPALEALEAAQKRKGLVKEARNTHKRLLDARKMQIQSMQSADSKGSSSASASSSVGGSESSESSAARLSDPLVPAAPVKKKRSRDSTSSAASVPASTPVEGGSMSSASAVSSSSSSLSSASANPSGALPAPDSPPAIAPQISIPEQPRG